MPFNWYDYIWVTSPQYYVNAIVSGGSDKINYYFSVGHMNQESAIRNYGGMKRYNVQMNVEAQVTDKFKIGMNMNGRIKQLKIRVYRELTTIQTRQQLPTAIYRLSVRLPMTILTIRHQ